MYCLVLFTALHEFQAEGACFFEYQTPERREALLLMFRILASYAPVRRATSRIVSDRVPSRETLGNFASRKGVALTEMPG